MKRLTEWDEYGNADIIALSDVMPEIYSELSFSETNALTDALNRLAAYEDTGLEPDEITTKKPVCVFYCNRRCNLDGDWCAEGPGCPKELDSESAMKLLKEKLSNAPLTLEELWEMDGEPVWNDTMKKWYFVVLHWEHGPVAVDYKGNWRPLDDRYYRRKPEEG